MICGGSFPISEKILPDLPEFTWLTWLRARSTNYYEPIFYEWFRFAGNLTWLSFSLTEENDGFREIDQVDLKVLQGLLNRCARLMLAHMALSHEQKFGETTAILDRCIMESSIKLRWLCRDTNDERFRRFKSDGLKNDLKLKDQIDRNVIARGHTTPIEDRMLTSISNYLGISSLSEDDVKATKALPNLKAMMHDVGLGELPYVTIQNMGSHHVHGTWSSLLLHYLDPDYETGTIELRDHDCRADYNTYAVTTLMVLQANIDFLNFIFSEKLGLRDDLVGLLAETFDEVLAVFDEAGEVKTDLSLSKWSYLEFE